MSLSPAVGVGGNGSGSSGTGPITPHPLLGAQGTYHARNRDYDPLRGLWLQSEPNGSGQPIAMGLWRMGQAAMAPSVEYAGFNLDEHRRDGMNGRAYVRGSVVDGMDPEGLFGILDIGIGTSTLSELEQDQNDRTLDIGSTIMSMIGEVMANYAFDQYLDYHWASDWDAPDDLYRGSAEYSSGTGSWAIAADDAPSEGGSDGPAYAMDVKLKQAMKAARSGASGLGVYFIYDKAGDIIYAGRSKDMAKRIQVQLKMIPGASKGHGYKMTSKFAVRALEDLAIRDLNLIKKGQNMINGISDSSKNKKKYYKALIKAMSHLK